MFDMTYPVEITGERKFESAEELLRFLEDSDADELVVIDREGGAWKVSAFEEEDGEKRLFTVWDFDLTGS